MKILQIHNEYLYYGGEDAVVDEEANLLRKNGHDVIQLLRKNKNETLGFRNKFKTALNLSFSSKSLDILNKKLHEIEKPDIAHVHNIFPLWSYSIFKLLNEKRIPIVMTLHNYRLAWCNLSLFDNNYANYGYFKNSRIKTFLLSKIINKNKNFLDYVDKFVALTEFTKNKFVEANIPENKLVIKPNFLSDKKVNFKKINEKKNAIFASRISKEKGILTLLKSWKNIDLKINIYGDGPLYDKIKINSNNVQFHGNCSRVTVSSEIKNSKFLIFPSEWYECMPMTILESFREGTLVLASNIGSIKSIIKDKYNGVLFNPYDPDDILNKVKWVLNNPKKCDEIVINAMNDFKNFYSEEVNYKLLLKIYEEIINKKVYNENCN